MPFVTDARKESCKVLSIHNAIHGWGTTAVLACSVWQHLHLSATHCVVVPPEDEGGWLWAVGDDAGEVHGGALLQVDVGPPQDLGPRLSNHEVDDVRGWRRG